MDKIIIYTQNTCGYCEAVKNELTKNNIEFEARLINEFQDEWDKVVGLTNLPTTEPLVSGALWLSGSGGGSSSGSKYLMVFNG